MTLAALEEWMEQHRPDEELLPWQVEVVESIFSGCRTFFVKPRGAGKQYLTDLLCEYVEDQGLKIDSFVFEPSIRGPRFYIT